jgi:hypothetical protein
LNNARVSFLFNASLKEGMLKQTSFTHHEGWPTGTSAARLEGWPAGGSNTNTISSRGCVHARYTYHPLLRRYHLSTKGTAMADKQPACVAITFVPETGTCFLIKASSGSTTADMKLGFAGHVSFYKVAASTPTPSVDTTAMQEGDAAAIGAGTETISIGTDRLFDAKPSMVVSYSTENHANSKLQVKLLLGSTLVGVGIKALSAPAGVIDMELKMKQDLVIG